MKAANLEVGFVIRYDNKPWRVRDRAISTARGDGCVILAELHDSNFDVFVGYLVALVFDRFDEEVWVYHFASSPHPTDWAIPKGTDWDAYADCPRAPCHAPTGSPCVQKRHERERPHIERIRLSSYSAKVA